MKVYIMTDMEGVSGIHKSEYVQRGSDRYAEGRKLFTEDVNAAVAGCFDAGATQVVVRDAHSGGDHLLMDEVDARAVIDHGGAGRWTGELDETFDAAMIVGQHAMAGTPDGFLDHTQSSTSWFEFSINGRPVGEIGQFACIAGGFDVPIVMLSGDKAATEEARALLGDIAVAAVKEGRGRMAALCLAPKYARELIRKAAAEGIGRVGKIAPWKPKLPMEILLKVTRSDYADEVAHKPGNERLDARTIRRIEKDPLGVLDVVINTRPRA
jgi:D-amino peptidase